jgi:hypothetical protein
MIESFRVGRYGEGFRKGVDRIDAMVREARRTRPGLARPGLPPQR